jgi:PIN domain-containing protein
VAETVFFTDNHVRGPVIKALRKWAGVVRAIDVFGEENDDEDLLAHAAKEGMVFLTSDEGIHTIASARSRTPLAGQSSTSRRRADGNCGRPSFAENAGRWGGHRPAARPMGTA